MSAPPTLPPCPVDWCARGQHKGAHESRDFLPDALIGVASVLIEQDQADPHPPLIKLWRYKAAEGTAITPWGYEALALADVIEQIHSGSPLAAALREARGELDAITGGGS